MNPLTDTTAKQISEFEKYVSDHPGRALLGAVGIGFVIGLAARALGPAPAPPQSRALRLLEDIRQRLGQLAQPAYRKVSGMAEDGATAVKKGVDRLGDLHLDRKFDKLGDQLKMLFR